MFAGYGQKVVSFLCLERGHPARTDFRPAWMRSAKSCPTGRHTEEEKDARLSDCFLSLESLCTCLIFLSAPNRRRRRRRFGSPGSGNKHANLLEIEVLFVLSLQQQQAPIPTNQEVEENEGDHVTVIGGWRGQHELADGVGNRTDESKRASRCHGDLSNFRCEFSGRRLEHAEFAET